MKIKIVEIIGGLAIGGAENQVVQLLNGWDSVQFEKHLVYFRAVDSHLSKALEVDVAKHHIPLPRWGQLGCIARLASLFRRLSPHVVQAHMFHTNLYVVLAARLAKIPVVVTTEHGKNLWKHALHHLIERQVISPLATRRVAVSQDIRDIRVQSRDIPADKILVIPPCVEIPQERVEYRAKSPVRIGAVGRMVEAKDYPTLLRAFARVVASGIVAELVFLGDGPDRPRLERMSEEMGMSGVVHFAGFQSNVGEWLEEFDLAVFSSVREGIPVAMLEAMAAGVPMVATRVGGIPEVIRDGVEGLLVESRHPEELAVAIMRVAQDVDLRAAIGMQGRKRIVSLYSREAICGRYEALFRDLLVQRSIDAQ